MSTPCLRDRDDGQSRHGRAAAGARRPSPRPAAAVPLRAAAAPAPRCRCRRHAAGCGAVGGIVGSAAAAARDPRRHRLQHRAVRRLHGDHRPGVAIYAWSRAVEGSRAATDRGVTLIVDRRVRGRGRAARLAALHGRHARRRPLRRDFFTGRCAASIGAGGGAYHAILGTLIITGLRDARSRCRSASWPRSTCRSTAAGACARG